MKLTFKIATLMCLYTFGTAVTYAERLRAAPRKIPNNEIQQVTDSSRTLRDFRELEVEGNFSIELKKGDVASIHVDSPTHDLTQVRIQQEGQSLAISCEDKKDWKDTIHIVLTHSTPLTHLELKGKTALSSKDPFFAEDASLEVDGASDIHFEKLASKVLKLQANGAISINFDEVRLNQLDFEIAGAVEAKIKGSSVQLNLDIKGAARVDGEQLAAQHVVVRAAGAASVVVNPTESLTVEAMGASKVKYASEPKKLNINTAGFMSTVGRL